MEAMFGEICRGVVVYEIIPWRDDWISYDIDKGVNVWFIEGGVEQDCQGAEYSSEEGKYYQG